MNRGSFWLCAALVALQLACAPKETPSAGSARARHKDQVGVYDPATGTFFLRTESGDVLQFQFGSPGLVPVAGDFDGGGITTVGVWDANASALTITNRNASGPSAATIAFRAGWGPIVGDWDGDGKDSVGGYDPPTGRFSLRGAGSSGDGALNFDFGSPRLVPLGGDWDGDGKDTVGLYNPATATFFLNDSNRGGDATV